MCTILFCLANLYINVELSQPISSNQREEGYWCVNHWCRGPQAIVKVGMPIPVGDKMLIYYGFKHTSFPMESMDKGQDMPFVSFTWVPFR
jgi:hypothetical protein